MPHGNRKLTTSGIAETAGAAHLFLFFSPYQYPGPEYAHCRTTSIVLIYHSRT